MFSAGEQVQSNTWHDGKEFVHTVMDKMVEKFVKGAWVTITGTLHYEKYEKPGAKTAKVKMDTSNWMDRRLHKLSYALKEKEARVSFFTY